MPEEKLNVPSIGNLNPRVVTFPIGVSQLRNIKVIPLSLASQMKISDAITADLVVFLNGKTEGQLTPVVLTDFALYLIKKHIVRFLTHVIDDPDTSWFHKRFPTRHIFKILKEMDNVQLAQIIKIIYDQNYGDEVKNLVGLLKEMLPIKKKKA